MSNDPALKLLQEVNRRKAEISELEGSPNFKTNRSFSYTDGRTNDAINLATERNVGNLTRIAAFLIEHSSSFEKAIVALDVEKPHPKFEWQGKTLDAWLHDLKLMVAKLNIVKKKEQLVKLESRLNAVMSPETRRQLEIEAITKELEL